MLIDVLQSIFVAFLINFIDDLMQAATEEASTKKLWGGRFTGKTDPLMEKFNESLPFDKRMWAEDIRVCRPNAQCICMPRAPTYVNLPSGMTMLSMPFLHGQNHGAAAKMCSP